MNSAEGTERVNAYTEGPWELDEDGRASGSGYPTIYVLASVSGKIVCKIPCSLTDAKNIPTEEIYANAHLIVTAPDLLEALKAYEALDDFHANCPECDGELQPELCDKCFPLADDARLKMRAALAKATAKS